MRRLILAAAAAALLAVPAVASSATKTYFPDCGSFTYKPKSGTIACGDGNFLFKSAKCSKRRTKSATGKGKASLNTCDPNCAQGKFKSYSATIKLTKRHTCSGGVKAFGKIEIDFKGTPPTGYKKKYTQKLGCPAQQQQG